jgi:hypothetical protein
MSMKTLVRCAFFLVLANSLLSIGCLGRVQQAAQRAKDTNDLKMLGLVYHSYLDAKSAPPATVDDLATFDPNVKIVTDGVKSGKYKLYLGVSIIKLPEGASNTVLGYHADAPVSGGPVLMADGFCKTMTPTEFAAAPKPAGATLSQP